jgi:16S rRNA (uracil1498-N3)-methyltransferase
VTASVFLVEPAALIGLQEGSIVSVDGPEARHAVSVMRLEVGETLELVDGHGRRITGVVALTRGSDHLEVTVRTIVDEPPAEIRFIVAQALPKGEHGELAVDLMTQTGVDVIVPWRAQRSVVQWKADRVEKSLRKWQAAAVQAAKQSRRARTPVIAEPESTSALCSRVASVTLALILHEEAQASIADVPLPSSGEILLIVGPEGGISDEERSDLGASGAIEVRMGPTVLRSSLAGATAITAIATRTRWANTGMGGSKV